MTANATLRPRDRSASADPEESFRRAVPMTGTGDGPRPDSTAFAPAARRAGGRSAASNRTADDATQ
ncbi:hypothetical protein [uncultured Halorubrum sp.]|jgi:hypothetical protein|uniref:hypothetical protein n=1 Tax=uncultured Halorubrum sp. TaxID=399555 RepID=UPI002608A206|nr:hypothetical protein [uncultured Halorubrum sp.]